MDITHEWMFNLISNPRLSSTPPSMARTSCCLNFNNIIKKKTASMMSGYLKGIGRQFALRDLPPPSF
ncbi:hypothetical protein C5167_046298 [Papaver somniferum]|uniref:Uncharacterized protein n=1 Tax=Papaver somniferum TaxID=3469 RepID=A0A4Y7LEZ7_PAPSO|nr:hypothetical protein C5167_046298 [Papaver somniferum]